MSNREEMYREYLNQSEDKLELIMQSIRIKNEMFLNDVNTGIV